MENKIISVEDIYLDVDLKTAGDVFEFIATQAAKKNICSNETGLITKLKEREEISSTGFESSIAIPHTQFEEITKPKLFFIRSKNDIDWKAMDGNPTRVFFCILVPKDGKQGLHIEILGNLASKLLDNEFLKTVLTSKNKDKILKLILQNEGQTEVEVVNENQDYYLAVVACTFGLAHTYIAEQKLNKFAKDNNFKIKVETYGSKGHQNIINEDDLKKAKGVLIAIDKDVDVKHIKHANIHKARTIDAINDTNRIFDILSGKVKVSKFEQNINTFFKIKLSQSLSFSYGKTYNYIRFFALGIGLLMFINQFLPQSNFIESNNIIEIISYSSLVVAPMIAGLLVFNFTKSETTSAVCGLSIFSVSVFNIFVKKQDVISFGMLGSVSLAIISILYIKYIFESIKKLIKVRKINGGVRWLFEIIYFFIALSFVYFTFTAFDFVNEKIYTWILVTNNYWWFRWIIASVFFILMVIDMGGPINKWGLIISTLLMVDSFAFDPVNVWLTPITAQVIAITTPGFSLWVRGVLLGKKLSNEEKQNSKESGKKAFNGISEGALWMIKKYKYKAHIVNVLLGVYTGFVIGFLNIRTFGGYNTILGSIFGFSTDELLMICGIDYLSVNLGFLIMTLTAPIVGGVLGCMILHPQKNIKEKNK